MKVRFSEVEVAYSARGNPTYRVEIWHDGLKKHRLIRGSELEVVERKAQLQAEDWQSKWEGVKAKEVAQKAQADKNSTRKIKRHWLTSGRSRQKQIWRYLNRHLSTRYPSTTTSIGNSSKTRVRLPSPNQRSR